jgi:hypothetical protein
VTKQSNLSFVRAGEVRMEEGESHSKRPGGRTWHDSDRLHRASLSLFGVTGQDYIKPDTMGMIWR